MNNQQQNFDDDNQGAVWKRSAWSGKAVVAGQSYVFDIVSTGEPQNKFPSHRFSLTTRRRDDHQVYNGVLWRPKQPKKYVASGHVWIGDNEWLIFAYAVTSDNPQAPAIRLSFLPKDHPDEGPQASSTGRPLSDGGDDSAEVPF